MLHIPFVVSFFDKTLPFDRGNISRTDLYVNVILTTNVGCGADDRGRDVSGPPSYRESDLLFGHFTRHENKMCHRDKGVTQMNYPAANCEVSKYNLLQGTKQASVMSCIFCKKDEPRATPIIGVATKLTLIRRCEWLVVMMLRGCWAFGKRRPARERTDF
jgi:hypothetical protein